MKTNPQLTAAAREVLQRPTGSCVSALLVPDMRRPYGLVKGLPTAPQHKGLSLFSSSPKCQSTRVSVRTWLWPLDCGTQSHCSTLQGWVGHTPPLMGVGLKLKAHSTLGCHRQMERLMAHTQEVRGGGD